MQQTFIILIVSTALIALVVLFLFLLTGTISNSIEVTATIFQGQDYNSKMNDNTKDTKLITLHKTNVVPEVKDYHDILSIDINKVNDNKMLFTIELAGDANKNENYETVYVWLVYYYTTTAVTANTASTVENEFHLYTIIIPNFGAGSNFGNKEEGWYLAIFNNTNNSYTLPLSRISDMPTNKVQVFIDPIFIGYPSSTFNYIVSSMIRVNNTFLDKPPDYLVDYVPDNYNSFWKQWFR
jgi:hypothetical protein